ncbi:hypothetical protein [Rhodobacter sp. JA431]|uniref:hypothetical protein n=1 Tax=Rhodobacter sp. JA431 TaxID=570013 RepID=UPI0011602534|nr:hypothetical protein [Rhodobacter sp. JA431]
MSQPTLQRPGNAPEASALYLVLPVGENIRSYANGDIRLAHLNTFYEPAAGASHVLVSVRSKDSPIFQGTLISYGETVSFSEVDLMRASSRYDPKTGLNLQIPVRVFDGQGFVDRTLEVNVDQSKPKVTSNVH